MTEISGRNRVPYFLFDLPAGLLILLRGVFGFSLSSSEMVFSLVTLFSTKSFLAIFIPSSSSIQIQDVNGRRARAEFIFRAFSPAFMFFLGSFFIAIKFTFNKSFFDGIYHGSYYQRDRFRSVIVGWYGEIHLTRVRICVDDGKCGDVGIFLLQQQRYVL